MSQKTSVYLKKCDFKFSTVTRKITSPSADSTEDTFRARLTQGKGEYEMKTLDIELYRPEHHDLTMFFRVVPNTFEDCSSAYERNIFFHMLFLSVRVISVNFHQNRKKQLREDITTIIL